MSVLIGAARPTRITERIDNRLAQVQHQYDEPPIDFRSPWWPAGGGMVGDLGLDVAMLSESRGYEYPELTRGISSRLGFVGITRDQYGAPLGGCSVRVFRTSDGVLVHETVSDANGQFLGCAYDTAAYFLVFYKAGSPDVFGTTVNTLVGS